MYLISNEEIQCQPMKKRQRIKANSRILPAQAVDVMNNWYEKNYTNPYPNYREFEMLATMGQITINQVKQWFVNVRRRTKNEFRRKRDPYKSYNQPIDICSESVPVKVDNNFVTNVPYCHSNLQTVTPCSYFNSCYFPINKEVSQRNLDYYSNNWLNYNHGFYQQYSSQSPNYKTGSPTASPNSTYTSGNTSSIANNSYGFDTFAF